MVVWPASQNENGVRLQSVSKQISKAATFVIRVFEIRSCDSFAFSLLPQPQGNI
jgi:hypothetical protein